MNVEDKKGFISCEYDNIDLIDTPYPSKLENGNLYVQFNFYNISNIEIKEKKKWSLFSGTKYEYTITINETFYTQTEKKSSVKTIIEFEDKKVMDNFLEKLSNKVKEIQSKNVDILSRDKLTILSLKAFKDLKRIAFESERQIAKLPDFINMHKGILKFEIEKYDIVDNLLEFVRKEFNFIKELELQDLSVEEDEINGKKHLVAYFTTKNDLYESF